MSQRTPPFHPHVSADGAWRWDGRAWVPVGAPAPEAAAVTPAGGPGGVPQHAPVRPPQDPPPGHPSPPAVGESPGAERGTAGATRHAGSEEAEGGEAGGGHGWVMVGALIGASLVVLAAIIGASLLIYRAVGSPPPNPVTSPTASPVDPNSLSYRYLPGVTVGTLTAALESDGFSCAAPAPPEDHLRNWRCDRARGTQHDIVQIWAVDRTHVHLVDVTTVARSGPLDEQGALALNTRVAHLVYPSSEANASAAGAWAQANPTGAASTSVGGITLRRDRSDVATLLEFDAGRRR